MFYYSSYLNLVLGVVHETCTHSPCPTPASTPYHLLAAGCYVLCLFFKCGDGKVCFFSEIQSFLQQMDYIYIIFIT